MTTEPAAVLQALIDRLNPVTPAEAARDLIETLTGLVSQAYRRELDFTSDLATALRAAQTPIFEAMQGMPRAAPRSALQGGQRLPRSSGSAETPDAASDHPRPGTGHRWACPRCGHDLEASIALVGEAWKGDTIRWPSCPGQDRTLTEAEKDHFVVTGKWPWELA